MPRRLATAVIVLAGMSAFAFSFGSGAGAAPRQLSIHALPALGGAMIKANQHETLPRHGGTAQSSNWSGYVVAPGAGAVTAVNSTFTIPTAGLIPPGFAATWTGIGGWTDSTLIQAGVAEQSLPSTPILGPQYFAWYELLPGASIALTNCTGNAACTVAPGNSITVNISQQSNSTWTIDVADPSEGWTWSMANISYASSQASAEWITEAPQVDGLPSLLAGLGTVHFSPSSTYTASGQTLDIAQGNPTSISLDLLGLGLLNEATPSALAGDGQTFNVCTGFAQTCATP